jgi:hypothetical protein
MEDMTIQSLEKSLREKILLYSDLLQCFKDEKEAAKFMTNTQKRLTVSLQN